MMLCACRQRVEIADARAALSKERIAASKAATDAAMMAATTAAHDTISLDTSAALGAATAAKRSYLHGRLWPSASVPHSVSSGPLGVAAAAVRRCNSTMGGASTKAGRRLRRMIDKLQDQGRGKRVSSEVKSQQDFLELLRSSSPVSNFSGSTLNHKAAGSAMLGIPAAAAPSSPVLVYPVVSAVGGAQKLQQLGGLPAGWQSTVSAQVPAPGFLSAGTSPLHAPAAQGATSSESNPAVMLLQQLAQLQQMVAQQQQQPAAQQQQQVPSAGKPRRRSSSRAPAKGAAAASAGGLLAGLDKDKLQQLVQRLQSHRKMQQHLAPRAGSCAFSRVSSDLTQMLTLSVSASSEDSEGPAEDGFSVGGDA